MPKNAPDDSIRRHGSPDSRGGIIYTNERGDRAIKLSSRPGVRVYSDRDKRIGPVRVDSGTDTLSCCWMLAGGYFSGGIWRSMAC